MRLAGRAGSAGSARSSEVGEAGRSAGRDPVSSRPVLSLPAATVRAILAGLRVLGLDAEAIRVEAGLSSSDLAAVDGLVPADAFGRLFAQAARRRPHEELVTEVGVAVPFGAFGALDYLVGSAPTVGAAFQALAAHFRYVSMGVQIEIDEGPGGGEVRLVDLPAQPDSVLVDEFTVAACVGRSQPGSSHRLFRVEEIRLTRPAPAGPTRHAALLGAPVVFGCAATAIRLAAPVWAARLPSANEGLQATLRQLAEHAGLGRAEEEDVILQVRSRLRLLLPEGHGDAPRIAEALGLSERTLNRRLQAAGTSFRRVLEAFREAETERLMALGRVPLAEVALRVGFSDQTAWNRAFRRWKGMSPREWVQSREGK